MQTINVERMSASLFNGWTDGEKVIVVDRRYGEARPTKLAPLFEANISGKVDGMIILDEVGQMVSAINRFPYRTTTFYVVSSIETFLDIQTQTPNKEILYLVI